MRRFIYAILLVISLISNAWADYRCPNTGKIVKPGMSMYEVTVFCGQPNFRAISGNFVGNLSANTGTLGTERWTYDFGPSSFLQFFNFDGGTLRSIEQGTQYGTVRSQKKK